MRRQILPVVLAISVGLIVLVHQFVANPVLDNVGALLVGSAAEIGAFAVLLGLFNVLAVHLQRLARRQGNGWSSLIILLTAVVVFVFVLPSGGASGAGNWIFQYVYRPLEASFLALLVFFIATAAYRALRARTWEMALLMLTALVVLVGGSPISGLVSQWIPAFKDWVVSVPAMAGVRGIAIGVALGAIATGLRVLFGIDRPYSD